MKCPICEKEMSYQYYTEGGGYVCEEHYKCSNKCYEESYAYGNREIFIFGLELRKPNELNKVISYWKTNDRYLMKLLEG